MAAQTHGIDESEAALYDRQLRLWGVEAQNRMRNASVLVVRLRGLAVEVCKNIVLAGIGKLTIADDADVTEEDLGSNYFVRESEALNPRVQISALTSLAMLDDAEALQAFDLVCVTDSDTATLMRVNALCRQHGRKFYGAASLGMSGYVFCDLISHDYTIKKTDMSKVAGGGEAVQVTEKRHQDFVPLTTALKHSWSGVKIRAKALPRMLALFETLGVLRYQLDHGGTLPDESGAAELRRTTEALLAEKGIDPSVLHADRLEFMTRTADCDFAPSCAVLGGILGQDILSALGGTEMPIVNFLAFDGDTSPSACAPPVI